LPLSRSHDLENAPKAVACEAGSYLRREQVRKGEFVYQGYLYDDHGAKETEARRTR